MFNIGKPKYPQIVTIWEVEDKGTYALVRFSTSRKDKDGNYANSNWSFVRFVGTAYNKTLLGIEPKTRIEIKSGGISLEPYVKDGEKTYPKSPQIVIFAWNFPEQSGAVTSDDDDMVGSSVEEDDNDLPF